MPGRAFSIVEPHPTVSRSTSYLAGGRGGAGNYRRYNSTDLTAGPTATGPASRASLFGGAIVRTSSGPHSKPVASTGIGGAGNMFARAETEERVFQFDEEMMLRRDTASAPVYHIGRGGGGNWVGGNGAATTTRESAVTERPPARTARLGSTSSTASSSGASVDSERSQVRRSVEGALGRLRDRFN